MAAMASCGKEGVRTGTQLALK